MRPAKSRLLSRHFKKPANQIGIERRAEADGLRKTRTVRGRLSVQAFFMKDHWDTEATVFDKELLNRIGQLGLLSGVPAAAGIAGPANLAQTMSIFEMSFGLFKIEAAFFIHPRFLSLPNTNHLGNFFFERHLCEQICDAFLYR
jgi:hypothetical protein